MNYYASPKDSDRARRFREAYANAIPGQNFMFEGQPYAGPEGLPPNQQVQQYIQPPPGGWTGGVDPNVAAAQNQMPGVTPRPGDMGGPEFTGKDTDYYAQNFFREFPVGLDGNPVYGGPLETPPSEGKGSVYDMEGNLIPPNSAGTSIPFDDPSIAGVSIPFPEQTPEQMASAMYRVGDRDNSVPRFPNRHLSPDLPYSVTGMSGPGQDTGEPLPGLLASEAPVPTETDYKLYDWLNNPTPIKQEQPGLLADNSNADKPGWEKDKKFNNALRQMVMQWGMNQATDDEW
jgi:hypothetical protein